MRAMTEIEWLDGRVTKVPELALGDALGESVQAELDFGFDDVLEGLWVEVRHHEPDEDSDGDPRGRGCPYDNAVDESTNRILKAELVHRETFGTTRELRAKLSDYVHWYNNFRIHSTLGYMSPVEFREAGLSLPESSK